MKKDPSMPDLGKDDTAFKIDSPGKVVPKGPFEVKSPYPRGGVQEAEFRRQVMNAGHKKLRSDNGE